MTPYELRVLMHIAHVYEPLMGSKELIESTIRDLKSVGVIEDDTNGFPKNPHGYRLTALGRAWLKDILSTPVPTIVYVGREGNAIEAWKIGH